jgi:hypothetical protein
LCALIREAYILVTRLNSEVGTLREASYDSYSLRQLGG